MPGFESNIIHEKVVYESIGSLLSNYNEMVIIIEKI